MSKEKREALDVIIGNLKEAAKRVHHQPDWVRLEADLRAFVAELILATQTSVRTEKGYTYTRALAVTATVTEARELLRKARRSAKAARALPELLSTFGRTTFGSAGLTLMPLRASMIYVLALDELDDCLLTYEE